MLGSKLKWAGDAVGVGLKWTTIDTTVRTNKGVATDGAQNWIIASSAGAVVFSTTNGALLSSTTAGAAAHWGAAYGVSKFMVNQDGGGGLYTASAAGGAYALAFSAGQILRNSGFNDGYFIIGANNGVTYFSTDGVTFTAQPAIGANSAFCGIYVAALSRSVALGVAAQSKYRTGVPSTAAWTGSCTGLTGTIYDVTWSPVMSRAVCVDGISGGIFYSTNLIAWTAATNPAGAVGVRGVCWAGDKFIAVGDGGLILTSSDGITWTQGTSGTSAQLWGVSYGAGTAIVGGVNVILRSN